MRTLTIGGLAIWLLLATACSKQNESAKGSAAEPPPAVAATQATPEQLGEIGAHIRKEPERAKEILRDHGMTEESFEAEIRKVTQNVDEARRYAAAFEKASS